MYARYLYHEKGLRKVGIIKELNYFMEQRYPRYNPVEWSASIEKYANKAGKYPLCECKGVWITSNELKTIEEIHNKVLERLAFTLLCLSKFRNFRNPNNNNWVNYSNGEIYDMACINTTAFEKDLKFNQLRELGLIEYAKKVNNLNIRVLYIDDESENILFVSDFRKLGNEWRLYKGEKYIRCSDCGVLIKQTARNKKYCKDCVKENQYYEPIGVKTVKCIDCGKEFNVSGISKNIKRCDICQRKKQLEYQRNSMKKIRLSV